MHSDFSRHAFLVKDVAKMPKVVPSWCATHSQLLLDVVTTEILMPSSRSIRKTQDALNACPAAPGVAVKDKARDGFANYDKQPERDTERLRNLCQDPEYRTARGAV